MFDLARTNKALATFATAIVLAAAIGLSGCSSNKSAFSGKGSPKYEGSDPIPRGGGRYKVGNPYQIAGVTYTPREEPNYDKTGLASWYGPKFHKRMTANGEWFDMNALTAAHPTLPIPSYVRVTNLENNKSLVVRVNDRGPYAPNRIIDMSRKSAQVLDFQNQGLVKVRVQYLGKAPLEYTDADIVAMNDKYRTRGRPQTQFADAQVTTNETRNLTTASIGGYFVQAASFSSQDNAYRLRDRLTPIGDVAVDELVVGSTTYYRVRVGPMSDHDSANRALEQVLATGQRDAHVVTN